MQQNQEQQIRLLHHDDIDAITRVIHNSEYTYQRFSVTELPFLLKRYPTVGLFGRSTLYGFLLTHMINPPCGWIGGFGVSWGESKNYITILNTLLEHLHNHLLHRGVHYLYYSGNDTEHDWLRPLLLRRGFLPYCQLYAYDKTDFTIPTTGNTQVVVRPVRLSHFDPQDDSAALQRIEEACFDNLWRYDQIAFKDIAATHPYFVVAEINGQVAGYQFNTYDDDFGYLIRIAVHPDFGGQGIGSRLMASAIQYFQQVKVMRIMLNTQEDNYTAHHLYERFGFQRLPQTGFVLRKQL